MDNISIWISLLSLLIAAISLGWNIHKEFIKPRLKVRLGLFLEIEQGHLTNETHLMLSVTNHGPGKVQLEGVILKEPFLFIKKILRKAKYAFLIHDSLTTQLPCELDVGKKCDFLLIYNESCFLKDNFVTIGILDSFGRCHWAPKSNYKLVKRQFYKDFKLNNNIK